MLHDDINKLVVDNLGLAGKIAGKFVKVLEPYGYTFQDLVQECTISLMRSVESFDKSRGYALSTYACNLMNKRMLNLCRDNTRTHGYSIVSLDEHLDNSDDSKYIRLDLIADDKSKYQSELENTELCNELLNSLSEDERTIVVLNTFSDNQLSQKEIAEKDGRNQVYVSRVQSRAFKKMRNLCESWGIYGSS